MAIVFLGVGSNLGSRLKNITNAIDCLKNTAGIAVDKVSTFFETEPVGAVGPNYLNGVIKIRTGLSANHLLEKLQNIEKSLGRTRSFKNAPRIIDLDILLYNNCMINEPELRIPHPRMFERDFVMKPLLEIEPGIAPLIDNFKKKDSQDTESKE